MDKKRKEEVPTRQKWLQRFFSVAGKIAPYTTIRILVRLMYKPRKREFRPSHLEMLKKATVTKFDTHEFRNVKKKIKVTCYTWGTGDKTILLVHGWDARAADFYKMVPALVDAGYKVMAFDGPGHGNSDGEYTNLVDFKELIQRMIKKKLVTPYAIIGHSMGGGSATYLLMEADIHVKRLITIALPVNSKRFFDGVFAHLKVPLKTQRVFYKIMAEEFGEPIERYNLIERKEPVKADKVLAIYDDEEEIISIKDLNEYLKTHPQIEPYVVKEVGHYRILKSKAVIDKVLDFLT